MQVYDVMVENNN